MGLGLKQTSIQQRWIIYKYVNICTVILKLLPFTELKTSR